MSNDSLPPGPDAVETLRRALVSDPQDFEANLGLAVALMAQQRFAEAEQHARQALAVRQLAPQAVRVLASLLQLQGRHAEALAFAEAVTGADMEHGEGWMARADSLANLGRQQEAYNCYQVAMRDGAVAFEALVKIGLMLAQLGHAAPAIQAFDAAISLDPEAPEPRYQRGVLRLAVKDFAQGWEDYESRWRSDRFLSNARGIVPRPLVPMLTLNPSAEALADRRVLAVGEQGVGDQLMFASMIPDLAAVAARVDVVCEPRLVRLLSASFEGLSVLAPKDAKIDTDVIDTLVTVGSLGSAFRRDAEAFPGTPYLRPRPDVREAWSARLGPRARRLRVGVSWRGGVAATRTHARSLALAQLSPILDIADCEFVSLQYGDVAAEVAAFNVGRDNPVRIFPRDEIDDFEDLAGLVANLDLVVSVQTALVHLCGAIGQTCLTLVPQAPEWRYGASGPTMPWYGSVRMFRQAQPGDWASAVAEVAAVVQASRPG